MTVYISKAKQLSDDIIKCLLRIDSHEKDDSNKYIFFYFSILYKTISTLKSVTHLLEAYEINKTINSAIGILLRSIMSDLIILLFVSVKRDDPQANANHVIENIYYDHYRYTKNNIPIYELLYKNDEFFIQNKAKFLEYESNFFDAKGKLPNYLSDRITMSKMIKYIFNKSTESHTQYLTILFEHYDIFSKLEHFGKMTMPLIAGDFHDGAQKLGSTTIQQAIEVSYEFCLAIIREIAEISIEENRQLDKLFQELINVKLCA